MTDNELYKLCKKYGQNALLWRRKFIGLLPEVSKRRLYEKKGYGSIFEFAAKLAGVSQEQVRRVLSIEKKFENKAALHNLLVTGEVSVNKLMRLTSVATCSNEEDLAEQVKKLSNRAVETMVQDFKFENGLAKPQNGRESVHVHGSSSFELSEEVCQKLQKLREKGIDVNELLLELLEKREEEIQTEKDQIVRSQSAGGAERAGSRHVAVRVKKVLKKEFGSKCAVPSCKKPSVVLHHTARFALTGRHNPYFMAPLCREHHEIAHAIDLKVHEKRRVH